MCIEEVESAPKRVAIKVDVRIEHQVEPRLSALNRQIVTTPISDISVSTDDGGRNPELAQAIEPCAKLGQAAIVNEG